MFLIVPAIVYYTFSHIVAYILYILVIVAAFCGVFSVCPICNTPKNRGVIDAFKPKKDEPETEVHIEESSVKSKGKK
jgi:sugar phosphate permease